MLVGLYVVIFCCFFNNYCILRWERKIILGLGWVEYILWLNEYRRKVLILKLMRIIWEELLLEILIIVFRWGEWLSLENVVLYGCDYWVLFVE